MLETNVVSELWKATPDPNVLAWADPQAVETLYLSAITLAELQFGLVTMPTGKRRTVFQDRLEREVLPVFTGRVLPFDLAASHAYGDLMSRARASGKAIGRADGYIAATAASRNLTVATRDTGPFEAAGLQIIDPWKAPS